jgi:hypothetical protein
MSDPTPNKTLLGPFEIFQPENIRKQNAGPNKI